MSALYPQFHALPLLRLSLAVGVDMLPHFIPAPRGAARRVNTGTTYGYDAVNCDGAETKTTICNVEKAQGVPAMARMKFICDAERCIERKRLRHRLQERENETPWA